VAALHLQPEPGNVPGNLRLAERAVSAAKSAHPALRWVVLPELFTCGYAGLRAVHRYAEDAESGPSVRFFVSLARRLGLYVAYGFPERRRSGGVSDSANLVGPRGLLLTYRKRRLVWTTDEPGVFVPDGLRVCELTGSRSVAGVDLGLPERWRKSFGSTLPAPAETPASRMELSAFSGQLSAADGP